MTRDRNYLISAYNATSTNPKGDDELETYEAWLERQLLSRIERLEKFEHPLPPAEGAEEITARDYLDYWIRQHGYPLDQPIG